MKQASPVEPTLGRNIRYVLKEGRIKGESRAAIITQVWHGIPAYTHSEVNLTVFLDLANDPGSGCENYATSAPYDPDKAPGTWHWPADAGDGFPTPGLRPQSEIAGDGTGTVLLGVDLAQERTAAAETDLPSEPPASAGDSAGDTPPAASNDGGSPEAPASAD